MIPHIIDFSDLYGFILLYTYLQINFILKIRGIPIHYNTRIFIHNIYIRILYMYLLQSTYISI